MLEKLLFKRRQLAKLLPRAENIVKGSPVRLNISCGKANCRCQKGEKHVCLYLSQSRRGKTKMTYIPKRHEKSLQEGVRRHRELLKIVEKLSECNLKILKLRKGERRDGSD